MIQLCGSGGIYFSRCYLYRLFFVLAYRFTVDDSYLCVHS